MNDLELIGAKNVMARSFIHQAIEDWEENNPWEGSGPDIGEFDFKGIVLAMKDLLPPLPPVDLWTKAYDYLVDRVDDSTA